MAASKQYYFRPVETRIIETSYIPVPTYTIECRVNVFSDAEMLKFSHEKICTFTGVEYNNKWDGILADIYTLIDTAL